MDHFIAECVSETFTFETCISDRCAPLLDLGIPNEKIFKN